MPAKAREIDLGQVQELLAQGLTRREIARRLAVPFTTLQRRLTQGPPQVHHGRPPDSSAHGPPRGIPEGHQGIPQPLTTVRPPEGDQGTPWAFLSPQLVQDLTAAWPALQELLAWWQERHRLAQEPGEKLERVTYHVAPKWIDAVKREADLTGESYAAIVNRAFARYFAERDTSGTP